MNCLQNSETIAHSVRPKERDGNKRKPSQKKKKKSSETETEPAAEIKRSIIAGTIQLKLSSVHHFKGNSFNGKSPPTWNSTNHKRNSFYKNSSCSLVGF